jgi:hypothetical protein
VKIVTHVGVIGSGKNYKSEKLIRERGYVGVDFKDALLDHVSDLLGYDVRTNYDWFKESIVGMRMANNPIHEQMNRIQYRDMIRAHPEILTGRVLLQRFGTDVMRKRSPNYWVDQFFQKVTSLPMTTPGVTCSDCRFPNELASLLVIDSEVVFCDYHSPRYDALNSHPSEWMAQAFLRMGLKDGDRITDAHEREMLRIIRRD